MSSVVELYDDRIVIHTKKYGDQRFYHLLARLAALHALKTQGYGTQGDPLANLRRGGRIGIPAWAGICQRMMDKWSRIEEYICRRMAGKDEQLGADTPWNDFGDNASYSLLCYMFLNESVMSITPWYPRSDNLDDVDVIRMKLVDDCTSLGLEDVT